MEKQEKPFNRHEEEFIAFVEKDAFESGSSLALIDLYCKSCWYMEEYQYSCFIVLGNVLRQLSNGEKMYVIKELVSKSHYYPRFVELAKELFDTLSTEEKKRTEVPFITWTYDSDFTIITRDEAQWRQRHNLRTWMKNSTYRRPCQALDILSFGDVVHMMMESDSSYIIYLPGDKVR